MNSPPTRLCPECNGAIGSKPSRCATCNRFSQAVLRSIRARFKDKYPEEYTALRMDVVDDLYTEQFGDHK